jgi:hypothetical protein
MGASASPPTLPMPPFGSPATRPTIVGTTLFVDGGMSL